MSLLLVTAVAALVATSGSADEGVAVNATLGNPAERREAVAREGPRPAPALPPAGARAYSGDGTWMTSDRGLDGVRGTASIAVEAPSADRRRVRRAHAGATTITDISRAVDGHRLERMVLENPAFNFEITLREPQMWLPNPPAPGLSWQWEATTDDGATVVSYRASIAERHIVETSGGLEPAAVVVAVLELEGNVRGSIRQLTVYASDGRLLLVRESGHGQADGIVFRFDTAVRAAPPGPADGRES